MDNTQRLLRSIYANKQALIELLQSEVNLKTLEWIEARAADEMFKGTPVSLQYSLPNLLRLEIHQLNKQIEDIKKEQ